MINEKNLSTPLTKKTQQTRVSRQNVNEKRAQGPQPPQGKGQAQAVHQRRALKQALREGTVTHRIQTLRGFRSYTKVMTGGLSVHISPIRAFYQFTPGSPTTIEAGFSVTRSIRNAVARNFVKRRLRESFRNNYHTFFSDSGLEGSLKVVFLYTGQTVNVRKDIKHGLLSASMNTILSTIRKRLTAKK